LFLPSPAKAQTGLVLEPDPSSLRVDLPRAYLSGWAQDVRGEILDYHSPVPTIRRSLLVRSEDRSRSIVWESQSVPEDFRGKEATFVFMIGIDVNAEPRRFDFRMNGKEMFQIANPTRATLGDVITWEGIGARGEFRVTLMDRYGDAMGFFFLTLPPGSVAPGEPVRFEVLGESAGARTWFMVFRDPLEPHVRISNAPAVLRTDAGEAQVLRLDLLTLAETQNFRMESPLGAVDSVVAMGHTRFTVPVPSADSRREVPLRLELGDFRTEVTYGIMPPRRIEIHLHHHTHLDIGYTHHQDEVERLQWAHLEEALRLGEASEDFPEGARFIWQPEGIWPVDSYVRQHPGEKADRLLEGIRRGWIALDGMYAGLLTGLANEEALLRSFEAGTRLAHLSGVPIESEMVSDIPGFTWGLVEAMSRNGIRYLSIGPNFGHRIGHLTEELGDRPFYWVGPSGENRVLTWVSGGGYAWFHTGLGYDSITAYLDEEKVFRYVDQLVADGYPYDLTFLRYNIGSDNGPPDPGLAEAVRGWNTRYASPTLRITGMTETFREFERRYGDGLPSYQGDMTGHWEDGAASSARETAMTRRAAESLAQTEKFAQLKGITLDPDGLEEAWRNVLLFYEHTWGSWNSISEPYSELTVTSWERKKAFAEEAVAWADKLREEVLTSLGEDPERRIKVHNTLPWRRTDLVVLPPEASAEGDRVRELGGEFAPSQRLSTGELAFLAEDVPAGGTRAYRVEAGEAPTLRSASGADRSEGRSASPWTLATSHYSVYLDPESGAITSLLHRPSGRELVDSDVGGLSQYVYVPGRDPAAAVPAGGGTFRWVEGGPLVWALEITTPGEGLREPTRTRLRLVEGLDRVDLTNRVAKAWVLDPEAALFLFPFAIDDPQVRFDVPFGVVRPEIDQLPGASKNYFSVQRWVDVSNDEGGVTLTTVEAPLIQLGEIRTDPIVTGWLEEAQPSPTIYSYVMNNYWETNYRAAQDDDVAFRYSLRAHGAFQEEAARRFGLEVARPLVVGDVGPGSDSLDLP
ncbi:MAG: glycoside hydrolase family 38 C-terminal domain-containing protein, partial [Gemmatimonadota bacterium]